MAILYCVTFLGSSLEQQACERYDPSIADHQKYEIAAAIKESVASPSKPRAAVLDDPRSGDGVQREVSMEKFFQVDSSLKDLFRGSEKVCALRSFYIRLFCMDCVSGSCLD